MRQYDRWFCNVLYPVFSSLWAGALQFLNSKEPCKQHLPQLYRTLRPYLPAEPSWLRWWELCGWGQKKYSSAPFHFGNFVIRWMRCFAFWVEMVHELETQPTGSWPWKTAAVSMTFLTFMTFRSFMTIDVSWGGRDTCCSVLWQQMLLHALMRRGVFRPSPQTQFLAVSGRTFPKWMASCHHSSTLGPF